MKYWSDFPPPACCDTIRPGTWRRMSETWVRERRSRSSRDRWTDDADSAGAWSSISMTSGAAAAGTAIGSRTGALGSPDAVADVPDAGAEGGGPGGAPEAGPG